MIEYTLNSVSDDIPARAKATAVYALVFILGAFAMLMWIGADQSIHVAQLERDCYVRHSFVAEGQRYYCAPWIEVAP